MSIDKSNKLTPVNIVFSLPDENILHEDMAWQFKTDLVTGHFMNNVCRDSADGNTLSNILFGGDTPDPEIQDIFDEAMVLYKNAKSKYTKALKRMPGVEAFAIEPINFHSNENDESLDYDIPVIRIYTYDAKKINKDIGDRLLAFYGDFTTMFNHIVGDDVENEEECFYGADDTLFTTYIKALKSTGYFNFKPPCLEDDFCPTKDHQLTTINESFYAVYMTLSLLKAIHNVENYKDTEHYKELIDIRKTHKLNLNDTYASYDIMLSVINLGDDCIFNNLFLTNELSPQEN